MSNKLEVYVEGKDDLLKLLQKTNKENPSKKDVTALKKALKENPNLWRSVGDIAHMAQMQIIQNTKAAVAVRESLRHGLIAMRKDLGYEEASAVEQLLIEQVVLAWLHYHTTQMGYESTLQKSTSFKNAAYWERRLNSSHRRYLRAVETLARIRKLGLAVQINIAEKQMNVNI